MTQQRAEVAEQESSDDDVIALAIPELKHPVRQSVKTTEMRESMKDAKAEAPIKIEQPPEARATPKSVVTSPTSSVMTSPTQRQSRIERARTNVRSVNDDTNQTRTKKNLASMMTYSVRQNSTACAIL